MRFVDWTGAKYALRFFILALHSGIYGDSLKLLQDKESTE